MTLLGLDGLLFEIAIKLCDCLLSTGSSIKRPKTITMSACKLYINRGSDTPHGCGVGAAWDSCHVCCSRTHCRHRGHEKTWLVAFYSHKYLHIYMNMF